MVGTDSCELSHVGFCLSGNLEVETNDGGKISISAGDSYTIPPGHNAHVVGDQPFQGVEFVSGADQARLDNVVLDTDATGVPEPTSLMILGTGLVGLGGVAWRRPPRR